MLTNIAQKMTELGFTLYEAKAYVCLLQNHPATRYEISKKSGVPRSAIYDVIHRLEEAGAVNVISRNPEKYMPLPPEQFTELLENRYNEKIRKFYDSVAGLNVNLEMGNLWDITGYENLLIKAREMIEGAETELYLSAWMREVSELEAELRKAEKRGVKVVLFSLTELPEIGSVFSYGLNEKKLA
ncbi:MAG: helix-turn-helix domain-containing protein, partial [Calditrichota bacterium]